MRLLHRGHDDAGAGSAAEEFQADRRADPRNLANIVLSGVQAVEGERSPIMPGFAASMTDAQASALLSYLRARFSNQPPWSGVEKTVQDARRAQTAFLQTSPEPHSAPIDPMQREKP